MISIAMTTYNGERFLREQIDSILEQTIKDFELIICDDCSVDSTQQILNEYEKRDSRVKVYINAKNIGSKNNFAKAISLCNGEFIALCDQDDVWTNNHLELLVNNIGDKDLICANAIFMKSDGTVTSQLKKSPKMYISNEKHEQFFQLFFKNFVQGCTSLFKRELLDSFFPIPQEYKYHDYWLAFIASLHNGIKYISTPIVYYRIHEKSITNSEKKSFLRKIKILFQDNKKNMEESYNMHKGLDCIPMDASYSEIKNKVMNYIRDYNDLKKRKEYCSYYFKNYNLINFTKNNQKKVFIIIKKFILGL